MGTMEHMNKLSDEVMAKVVGGINRDEAMAAAAKHAGVDMSQIMRKKCELDYDHGRQVYEIKFFSNGLEYEYDIDAETGRILKAERDWD